MLFYFAELIQFLIKLW